VMPVGERILSIVPQGELVVISIFTHFWFITAEDRVDEEIEGVFD
jgi:hypothetical protein